MRKMMSSTCLLSRSVKAFTVSLLLACSAHAQDTAMLSWQHPTEYTDGSPLPLSEIQNYMVFWSDTTCDGQQLTSSPNNAIVDAPGNTYETPVLSVGTWCFTVRALAVNNPNPSAPSNVAMKVIMNDPRAPNLSVNGDDQVYQIIQTINAVTLIPVGTVPLGTMCNGALVISDSNGLIAYQVDRSLVAWFGNVQPEVVFSRCGN